MSYFFSTAYKSQICLQKNNSISLFITLIHSETKLPKDECLTCTHIDSVGAKLTIGVLVYFIISVHVYFTISVHEHLMFARAETYDSPRRMFLIRVHVVYTC